MKRLLLFSALFPVVGFTADPSVKALIKKLEEKGILTREEVKEVKKASEKKPHLKVKIRLQPRFDFGDIYSEGGGLKSKSDFYFRRVRLEVSRRWKRIPLGKSVKISITLSSDKGDRDYDYKKAEKSHHAFKVKLKYAYVDWKIVNELAVRLGRKKMPYSRVSLTSSSRQLLIERPYSTEDAKKWLGDYDGNQIMFHGKIAKGVFRYMLSLSDGGFIEDKQKAGDHAKSDAKIGNFYAVRLEFSPPGFVEKKKDDTGIGEKNKGNVISLGVSYAQNRNFDVDTDNNTGDGYEVKNEKGTVWGADVFGRFLVGPGALTAQAEYVKMKYDKVNREEKGWYIQAGYLFGVGFGKLEPAFRYENVDYGSSKRKVTTLGFNHYVKAHRIKWAYNLLRIDNPGSNPDQTVHQIQAQFYF